MNKTVKINGYDYDVNSPNIAIDHFTKEYILAEEGLSIATEILLNRDDEYDGITNSVIIYQSSLNNLLDNGSVKILKTRFGQIYLVSEVIIRGGRGRIYPSNNEEEHFYVYDNYTNIRHNTKNKFRPFNNQVRLIKDFNSNLIPDIDKTNIIKRNIDFGVDSLTYKMFEGLQFTFGVELETSSGRLTAADVEDLNLKCEFDGSLRETPDQRKEDVLGGEYITGVLKGDAGMYQLQKICNKISEKCTINGKCGVHVHIGGLKLNKENIVYLYKLGQILQDEIYEMLPSSRRANSYCRKLTDLNINLVNLQNAKSPLSYDIVVDNYYDKIFKEVSHGKLPDRSFNKKSNHPMGSKCGYDKKTQRYCWLNFVTALFNTKGNPEAVTLEFRNHSATTNYLKIKNWIKICMAFVAFVENHKTSLKRGHWIDKDNNIFEINLETIVRAVYPKTYKPLLNYIYLRKDKFANDRGDIEELEYKTDKDGNKFISLKEDVQCV